MTSCGLCRFGLAFVVQICFRLCGLCASVPCCIWLSALPAAATICAEQIVCQPFLVHTLLCANLNM